MKRFRVTSNNGTSCVLTYAKGVMKLYMYGSSPVTIECTEEEFVNKWSNPEAYLADNEVYEI